MLKPPNRPWVIAHRGASHALRENTVPAFREAFARGADAAEMDVRMTADRCLVVHHDAVVPEVGPIIEMDRDDLEEAAPWVPDLFGRPHCLCRDVGQRRDQEFPGRPRLGRIPIGCPPDRRRTRATGPRPTATSSRRSTRRPSAWLPKRCRGSGPDGWQTPESMRCRRPTSLPKPGMPLFIPMSTLSPGTPRTTSSKLPMQQGCMVIVWTVDDTDEMLRLADAGVDGIITNVPGAARSAFEDDHSDGR